MAKGSSKRAILPILILFSLLFGCGGGSGETPGGSGSVPTQPPFTGTFPAKILSWQPPTSYSDNSPLDPLRDLALFEIYIKETGRFSDADSPVALVSAADPVTGQPTTSFNLANLGPFLSLGVRYQVSLRAVAISGQKSDFSTPANFSF